jgi:predicted double-glycine peptidase
LKRHFGRLVLFILLSFPVTLTPGYHQPFAYGQASTAALQESQPLPNLDEVKNLIRVPLVRQIGEHTCGVAALQSILLYYGEEFGQAELAGYLGVSPQHGTSYRAILRFANRKFPDPQKRDFRMWKRCGMTMDDLRQVIDGGRPPIIPFQAWGRPGVEWKKEWKDGHYAVAVGYDEKNIYFMDPSTPGHYAYIPIDEFLDRWHDRDPATGEKLIHCALVIGNDRNTPSYDFRVIRRLD